MIGGTLLLSNFFNSFFFFLSSFLSGWRWNPSERPSFAETHQAFETMFQESSISDGRCYFLKFRTFESMFLPKMNANWVLL